MNKNPQTKCSTQLNAAAGGKHRLSTVHPYTLRWPYLFSQAFILIAFLSVLCEQQQKQANQVHVHEAPEKKDSKGHHCHLSLLIRTFIERLNDLQVFSPERETEPLVWRVEWWAGG